MDVSDVVMSIVAITIGVLLIGSLMVPQVTKVMDDLTEKGHDDWSSMLGIVVVCSMVGLIAVALYAFKGRK